MDDFPEWISFFDTPSSNIELNSFELHYNQENIKEIWSNVHNCKKVWLTRRIIFARPVEQRQSSTGASVGVPSRFFPTEYTSRSQHRFSISPVAGPNFYHAIGDESFARQKYREDKGCRSISRRSVFDYGGGACKRLAFEWKSF